MQRTTLIYYVNKALTSDWLLGEVISKGWGAATLWDGVSDSVESEWKQYSGRSWTDAVAEASPDAVRQLLEEWRSALIADNG